MGVIAPSPLPESEVGCDPEQAADVFAALANPWRVEIARLLAADELDVTNIAARLGLSVANTSHHLGRLRRAGLVVSRRHGTSITSTLASDQVVDLCLAACTAAMSQSGTWCDAQFLTRADLRTLGSRHGAVQLHATLYAPDAIPGLGILGPLLEAIGRAVPGWGAFQVLAITKEDSP